ncbi:MAG: Ldh family oxidoreductase [Lachnospiraceae bacterium]|nr:Ldh family oxidoreductase [Lachnospiraceae bacterium]
MNYTRLDYESLRTLCTQVFHGYGFTEEEAREITDALLAADLFGIESHGIQRLVRYDHEIRSGMVDIHAEPDTVHETPVSATIDAHNAMGQLMGVRAMKMAIDKAKKSGIGLVTVRNSNHFGMAGYYARIATAEGLIGIGMTNAEAIMVPTYGRQPMIGTNPIAFAMPADPVPFVFDAATTVVPRGKLEVYAKRGNGIPQGWAVDENGKDCSDSDRVLQNIKAKTGGGILPLGGSSELYGGHKGYGFGMICEICCAILSLGDTANYIYKTPGKSGICHFFMAADPALFGDPDEIRRALSRYLQEIRESQKAEGQPCIYIQGEKELESMERIKAEGIPVNDKTLAEIREIASRTGADTSLIHRIV